MQIGLKVFHFNEFGFTAVRCKVYAFRVNKAAKKPDKSALFIKIMPYQLFTTFYK